MKRGTKMRQVRYAVVGLGNISQVAILPGFLNAKSNSKLTALVSDDPEKLRQLAKKYGVEHYYDYDEFDDCLQSGNVDAVYIALPNNLHLEYTLRAAKAGVHVLCEKPLALDERECKAMIRVCNQHGVKLMAAYRLHFQKCNLEAIEIVKSGKIGEPRYFQSTFSQQVRAGVRTKRKWVVVHCMIWAFIASMPRAICFSPTPKWHWHLAARGMTSVFGRWMK